jgi:hypothetical protein
MTNNPWQEQTGTFSRFLKSNTLCNSSSTSSEMMSELICLISLLCAWWCVTRTGRSVKHAREQRSIDGTIAGISTKKQFQSPKG